jgi:DNA-directed RNA polymerase specialized sigma24 family protein
VSHGDGRFDTTQWSLVLAARERTSPDAEAALGDLCQRYWYPLYSYVRRQGHTVDDASDLTQAFFTRLLEKNYLQQVDRERGRFRSFLLAACRHFLSNERDHRRAGKRGGRYVHVSIDAAAAEDRLRLEPSHDLTPEKEFLRRWALTVIDGVLASLRAELEEKGKRPVFDVLKPFLTGEARVDAYERAAAELGATEGSVRVSVHRLRRRFRQRLREEIARTVADANAVDDELRSLFASL